MVVTLFEWLCRTLSFQLIHRRSTTFKGQATYLSGFGLADKVICRSSCGKYEFEFSYVVVGEYIYL